MQTIKVKVSELITKLKENRIKHEEEYKLAVLEYRKACKVLLERTLTKVKPEKAKIDLVKPVHSLRVDIEAPECHLKEYDRVIMMMQMTSDTIIEISEVDFRQYVMDEWNWKREFMRMSDTYKSFSSQIHANELVLPARTVHTTDSGLATQQVTPEDPEAIG